MKFLSAFKKIISIVWLLHEALANYELAESLLFRKDHVNICTKNSYHSRSYCFYHNFLGYLEFAFNPDLVFMVSFLMLLTKYLTNRLFSMGGNSLIEKVMSLLK